MTDWVVLMNGHAWQAEFDRRVLAHIVEHGDWVRPGDEGDKFWQDYGDDYRAQLLHMQGCAPSLLSSSWQDKDWISFHGTFWEGSPYDHGFEARVTCVCSVVRERVIRWEGTHAELIRSITAPDRCQVNGEEE